MTTPDELNRVWRVVEAIPAINDLSAQYQNDIAEAILSERADLLAAVERMRGAMVRLLDAEFARDWRTWSDKRTHLLLGIGPRKDAFVEARAALTTGEG